MGFETCVGFLGTFGPPQHVLYNIVPDACQFRVEPTRKAGEKARTSANDTSFGTERLGGPFGKGGDGMGSGCGTAVCTTGRGSNLGSCEPKRADEEEGNTVLSVSALGFFT